MKKNKFSEFLKGKGYFVLLFVGVIAIAAVALIGSQLSSSQKDEEQNFVDLNDTNNDIAANDDDIKTAENDPISEGIANNESSSDDIAANDNEAEDVASDEVEYEDYSDTEGNSTDQANTEATKDGVLDTAEAASSAVKNDNSAKAAALSFKADDVMTWPVSGNVIMNYSMDRTIYFATLMQYKCNPAIIIDAEVGAEVKAARDGIVTVIDEDHEETGFTITMDIGGGYSVVYGQLDKDSVSLKVGDIVSEGDVIGAIDVPTKYYSVEGSNLYFEVLQDEETVNPMLFLR